MHKLYLLNRYYFVAAFVSLVQSAIQKLHQFIGILDFINTAGVYFIGVAFSIARTNNVRGIVLNFELKQVETKRKKN